MKVRHLKKGGGGGAGHVNVTPLIDVVMCLIIFYLMIGHLAAGRSSSVNLPNSTTGRPTDTQGPIVINVVAPEDEAGEPILLIGEERIMGSQLSKILKDLYALTPDAEVQIRADRKLSYGKVAPVLTACRDAGLVSVKLVAAKGTRKNS
ncbi:MAG: biopolymer transporter ExbD [Planctomycetes bacterium]|nr:biopolymer transporter ExbD [Planctomycetota bacterium]